MPDLRPLRTLEATAILLVLLQEVDAGRITSYGVDDALTYIGDASPPPILLSSQSLSL